MTYTMTPQQRHKCMSRIHSRDTTPELLVRRWLWSHGYRYRLNVKGVPGKPDIVMRPYHTAIFVNGCFWHGHEGCDKFRIPKSNVEFWQNKINRNQERDRQNYQLLKDNGWHVIVIWECQLQPNIIKDTMLSVETLLCDYFLKLHQPKIKPYPIQEEEALPMAAESNNKYNTI